MFRWLVIGFLAGLRLSFEEAQCNDLSGYPKSFCYNTSSEKTCFTKSHFSNNYPAFMTVEEVSGWFTSTATGSSLIIINSLESQGTVEIFKGRQVLANGKIVLDAKKLSANDSFEWPGANGNQPVQISGAEQFRDIACVESLNGKSLTNCVDYVMSEDHYICEYSGTSIPFTNSGDAKPDDSSYKQCICISPPSNRRNNVGEADYDGKWWSCNCNLNCAIVCHKGVAATDDRLSPTPAGQVLLILLVFVAVAFIVVAVIFIIRKRKYAGRHEVSPLKTTAQNEAVHHGYETMVPDNRPSGGSVPIYTELEMTQQPTPSNSTTYASIQPTSEVVVIGKSVDYTDTDFPKKDQQNPRSADKGTVSVSPIYSQPFESPTSACNTDYVEPYKPDKAPTETAPVQSHQAAADQQNIYSLAKEIPLVDPSVIYSEPNKPKKSSAPTGKEVKVTDPVYLNVIEVKPGAGSEGIAIQDPSAVYAEPIK